MEKGHDIKASLCISMQTLDSISFSTSLKDTHLHLSQLQDQSGCNIFHDIADCIVKESYLLEYLDILTSEFSDRYFEGSKDLIKQMLNQHGGRERLTPLMYAVKHNRRVSHNQLLLEKFVKLGGDFWRKDANGQSLVHMAAAQGFDAILVYLCFVLNMSYVENEKNGRSPLHLACLEGQVSTGMLLIVWNEELDLQDVEDFTPLHLAVLSSSYKLIRNLVIMGADLKVKDKKGETAFEIALSHGCDAGIIKLLEERGCGSYCNPFRQKIGPVTNGYSRLVIFLLFSVFRAGVISTVVLPRMKEIVAYPSVGLFFVSIFAFFVCCCKDPGYTKNPKRKSLMNYFEKYRGDFICPYCEIRKPRHTRHCHYCKRCVKEFDHHCPWIHNCVGKNNHFWFMVFVTFAVFDYCCQIAVGVLGFIGMLKGRDSYFYEIPDDTSLAFLGVSFLSFCFLLFVFPVWAVQIYNCIRSPPRLRKNGKITSEEVSRSISESSDTGSMLIRPSSDFNPASHHNQSSFLLARKNTRNEEDCC